MRAFPSSVAITQGCSCIIPGNPSFGVKISQITDLRSPSETFASATVAAVFFIQFRDGKTPCRAMHCSKTAPVAVKIGLAVGSAKVVCPSPP